MKKLALRSILLASCMMAGGASAIAETGSATSNETENAQSAEQATPASEQSISASEPAEIGDIVVTAQKREQRLQDVPITVSVVSQQQIESSGFRDIRDLALVAPGIKVQTSSSETATSIRIRGVGTSGDNPGLESSVGIVIDGVYRPRSGVAFSDLGEIERIEILKGPQGTLFGKNTSAGVVNVITAAPSFETKARAEVSASNYGGVDLAGYVSGGLSDRIAASFYAARRSRDGFNRVVTVAGQNPSAEDQNRDFYTFRGKLLFEPSDRLKLNLIADYTKRNEHCCAAVPSIQGPTAAFIRALAGQDSLPTVYNTFDRVAYMNSLPTQKVTDKGISLQADWNTGMLGGATLTSITAARDWKVVNGGDVDYTLARILSKPDDGRFGQRFQQFSQELRLTGKTGRLNWLVGGFYAHEKLTRPDSYILGEDYSSYLSYLLTASVPAPYTPSPSRLGCFSAAVYSSACVVGLTPATGPVFAAGSGYSDLHRQTSNSIAVFTNNSLQLTDALELTLGLRFTHERKTLISEYNNIGAPLTACSAALANSSPAAAKGLLCLPWSNPFFDGLTVNQARTENALTGTFKVAYRVAPELLLFAGYARGYKAGGFNLDRVTSGVTPVAKTDFDAEYIDAFEIGFKSDLFNRTLRLNGSIYLQKMRNYQINTFSGLSYIIAAIPKATSKGVDLDFIWQTPLDGLRLQGGLAYNDATYGTETVPSFPLIPHMPLQFAPKWSGTLGVNYEKPISNRLVLRADISGNASTRYYTGGDGNPIRIQGGIVVVNSRLGIMTADERWSIEGWARNLFDRKIHSVIFQSPLQTGSYSSYLMEPRTYGITLRYKY